jgi:hypothetical protein
MQFKDLTGQQFGNWKVLKIIGLNKHKKVIWLCECQCKDKTKGIIDTGSLKSGNSKSCGCLHKEIVKENNKILKSKHNTYELSGEYGIGYDLNNKEFYFDIEDYDKIKEIYWWVHRDKYVIGTYNNKVIQMHNYLLDMPSEEPDHINRIRYDNRKQNLRKCKQQENNMNRGKRVDNTSGVTGVYWSKTSNKWGAKIENFHLGYYANKIMAIKARLKAEKEYFGEFAPQKHLYKKYEVE